MLIDCYRQIECERPTDCDQCKCRSMQSTRIYDHVFNYNDAKSDGGISWRNIIQEVHRCLFISWMKLKSDWDFLKIKISPFWWCCAKCGSSSYCVGNQSVWTENLSCILFMIAEVNFSHLKLSGFDGLRYFKNFWILVLTVATELMIQNTQQMISF